MLHLYNAGCSSIGIITTDGRLIKRGRVIVRPGHYWAEYVCDQGDLVELFVIVFRNRDIYEKMQHAIVSGELAFLFGDPNTIQEAFSGHVGMDQEICCEWYVTDAHDDMPDLDYASLDN